MKICIIGSYKGVLDEGMTNVSYYLYENLRNFYPNLYFKNVQDIRKVGFWIDLMNKRPDIVHFIPGPTVKGLIFIKLLKLLLRCKTVVSATKPVIPKYFGVLSRMVRPDVTIVQSKDSENLFKNHHYEIIFIPNGVDTNKFRPISLAKRRSLRIEYGFSENEFIALHVGPIRTGRNQQCLLKLKDVKLLLIVSCTNPSQEETFEDFESASVVLWRKYIPNIEDIYAMVDVYIFPVFESLNSIETPLSVLEAMSCNIPVITTRYGALDRLLEEGQGLFYIKDPEKIQQFVDEIRNGHNSIETRAKVSNLSWNNIAREIAKLYEKVHNK